MTTTLTYEAVTGVAEGEAAGLLQARRPRAFPETIVGIYDAVEAGLDEWGFATVCEVHSRLVIHDSKTMALHHAPRPDGWCGPCRGEGDDS